MEVTAEAKRTLSLIRECIETDRFALTDHFSTRMQERALFWPDIQAVIDDPKEVFADGMDEYNRPKWKINGEAADLGEIQIVCAIETDESETLFITLYWDG